MLGEVPGQDNEQLVKSIEIGDLSMRTNKKTIKNGNKPHILKESYSTPECHFFAPWFLCNKGFFRIYLTIVGPQAEQPESYFPLSRREAKGVMKALSDTIKSFVKELR